MTKDKPNLTCEELEIAIHNLQKFFKEQEKLKEVMKVISPTSTGVVEFGSEFIDAYINLLEKSFDDNFQWISWFIFENDFGRKGMEAKGSSDKKLTKIKTVRQLYNIMNS